MVIGSLEMIPGVASRAWRSSPGGFVWAFLVVNSSAAQWTAMVLAAMTVLIVGWWIMDRKERGQDGRRTR